MSIETFEKQTWERWPVWGSILDVQNSTETVVLNTSFAKAMDKDGNLVSDTFLDQATKQLGSDPDGTYTDNMLGIRCQGGSVLASPYYITFYMVTSEGNHYEVDVKVKIKKIPTSPIPISVTTTTSTSTTSTTTTI